jgi:hypothetical protein
MILAGPAPIQETAKNVNSAGPRYIELRELVVACGSVLDVSQPRRRLPRNMALAPRRMAELVWRARNVPGLLPLINSARTAGAGIVGAAPGDGQGI